MYILLLLSVLGIFIALYISTKDGWCGIFEVIFDVFFGFLVGGTLGLLIAIIIGSFIPDKYTENVEVPEYKIYNLQDNSNVSGSFFLGSGRVDEKMAYTFYIHTVDGYVPMSLETSTCAIKETDDIKPQMVSVKRKFKNKNFDKWAATTDPTICHIIYVPKGTIVKNYNLDAKY